MSESASSAAASGWVGDVVVHQRLGQVRAHVRLPPVLGRLQAVDREAGDHAHEVRLGVVDGVVVDRCQRNHASWHASSASPTLPVIR